MAGSRGVLGRSKQVFIQFWLGAPTQIATDIGSEMALDNRPLTALGASEQQASLAALPEDLWRKIASLARPPTVRALVVACSDASLRSALRTDIDRAERAAFGLTQREAECLLVDPLHAFAATVPVYAGRLLSWRRVAQARDLRDRQGDRRGEKHVRNGRRLGSAPDPKSKSTYR